MDLFTINLYTALASPLVGSAIAAGAQRFAEGRLWDATPSACPACRRVLAPAEMAPVISWVVLRGRCRSCETSISAAYPITELLAVAIAVLAWIATPASAFALTCVLGWLLLALSAIDIRTRRLPDVLTLTTLGGGLVAAAMLDQARLLDHVLGAVAGYSAFVVIELGYRRVRKVDGLGRGDAKLLGALGAWVGWQGLASIVLLAAASAIGLTLIMAWLRRVPVTGTTSTAFGPYLALAGWLTWLVGPLLI